MTLHSTHYRDIPGHHPADHAEKHRRWVEWRAQAKAKKADKK